MNINEQLGLFNTRLTAQYCELIPDLLRPLLVVIKRWAKSHNLNDPSGSSGPISFSSYALVLMTIGYLQASVLSYLFIRALNCPQVKGVLPNLQAGLEPLPPDAKQGLFWLRSPTGRGTPCDIRFNSGNDWKPPVHLSVEEALMGWFTFVYNSIFRSPLFAVITKLTFLQFLGRVQIRRTYLEHQRRAARKPG